ncbi:MAG: hypothetical protein ACJ741_09865 [Pyrinomonadaceae bacterium]
MRRRVLAGVAAMLMGVSLIFAGNVSAHNIDLVKAREVARAYARQVRDESGGKYAHYSTSCVAAFPGHNHIARCMIDYKNAADSERGTYTCRELIEIKMPPHSKSGQINFELYGYHASNNQCGSRRLNGTPMF